MIEIPVYDTNGKKVGSEKLDPAQFGEKVRYDLLKQAVVAYRANQRQGTAHTKGRSDVAGSTRKLYRQKGTGRSRPGPIRTPLRRGGGVTFAKRTREFRQKLPQRMRRTARNSAILAKAEGNVALILKGLAFDEPRTGKMAKILGAVDAGRGGLFAVTSEDPNLFKSVRNIPDVEMKLVWNINAYDVLRARKLIFTPEAFSALASNPEMAGRPAQAEA